MRWLRQLLGRARGAPDGDDPTADAAASGPAAGSSAAEPDLDRAQDHLFEQERLLQHARRRLADLGVAARLHEQEHPAAAEALDQAIADLRGAVDDATAAVERTRSDIMRLRAQALSAHARLELHGLMDAFDDCAIRVRAALEHADAAVVRLEAGATARDELDGLG